MTRWRAAILLFACAGAVTPTRAAEPADFARQWPVLGSCNGATASASTSVPATTQPPGAVDCEGAFAIALDESVYRQAVDPALRDLAAFDADGEPLAFGPMPQSYRKPAGEWRNAAWFALPPSGGADADALYLHVRRDTAGKLNLDATLSHGPIARVSDLLVDVLAGERQVEAIEFDLAMDAPDFSTALAIDSSDDLQTWRPVLSSAVIAQLRQGGRALVRRRIEFAPVSARYLRLHALGGFPGVPLRGMRLLLHADGPDAADYARASLRADPVAQDGRAFTYRLPARVPVDRVDIHLPDENAIASFSVSAREPGQRNWRYLGQLDAFRLRGAGLRLDNEAMDVAPTREGEWRIESSVALSRPPVLELSWRPEEWLLLTHGKPPFRIVAGSPRVHRDAFPLEVLVGEARRRYGSGWRPASATLGTMADAGGDAALRAWDPARKQTLLLWGVLALGALAVIVMVLRLLRQPDR
jgi:hypothetical protein